MASSQPLLLHLDDDNTSSMQSQSHRQFSSYLQTPAESDPPVHSSPAFENDLLNPFLPFTADVCRAKVTYGEFFGPFFLHLFTIHVSLIVLTYGSVLAISDIMTQSSFSGIFSFFHFFLSTNDVTDSTYVMTCVFCIFFSFMMPCSLMGMDNPLVQRWGPTIGYFKFIDLKCLKSFDAIFSYNWNYLAKRDVNYIRTKVSQALKESIPRHHLPNSSFDRFAKVQWTSLILFTALLTMFLYFPVIHSFDGGLFVPSERSFFYPDSPPLSSVKLASFRYLELGLLVCVFNYFGRKLVYYFTSPAPAPEKDSTRLWYLIFLKLVLFSVPISIFVVESSCFPTDFGFYVFSLFILTSLFDVIFPFFYYKLRSLSKSFEKPLFDLPGSQAKVFTTTC
ncbi:hypothetical protein GEMRC1_005550 [Eukaryota sp. GEM-RC1]